MPYNRIKSFIKDVLRIDLSEGSIRNFIEAAGKKADGVCEKISKEPVNSPVGGADGSGFYVNGKLKWAWILQNPKLTLTWIAKGRGAREMTDKFGEDSLGNMVPTTDLMESAVIEFEMKVLLLFKRRFSPSRTCCNVYEIFSNMSRSLQNTR